MQKKRNSFPKKERLEDEMNNRFGSEEEFLARYEDWELDDIPDDPKDQRRRLEVMMEELRAKGHLSAEEEEKLFGPGGYLNNPATSKETPLTARPSDPPPGKGKRRSPGKMLYHMKKTAAVMAVVLGGITVVAFSSEANRQYVADMVTYAIGGDTRVKVKTGEEYLKRDATEYEAKSQIEEELEVGVPRINYRPENFRYKGCEIFHSSKTAYMFYELEGTEVVLYIAKNKKYIERDKLLEGKTVKEISAVFGKATIRILESKDADSATTYSAYWIYDNVYYQLGGKVELDELLKILEKITY